MCTRSPSVDTVVTKLRDAPSFTLLVDKFVKHEVENNSIEKAKMEELFVKPAEVAKEKKSKIEYWIPTRSTS